MGWDYVIKDTVSVGLAIRYAGADVGDGGFRWAGVRGGQKCSTFGCVWLLPIGTSPCRHVVSVTPTS